MSPRIFNIMVDAVVRALLQTLFGDDAVDTRDRNKVEFFLALFYVDNSILADRCSERHQVAIDALVGLFEQVDLRTNTTKTKSMVFVPGKIRTRLLARSYRRRQQGTELAKE